MRRLFWFFLAMLAIGYITSQSGSKKPSMSIQPKEPGYGTTRSHTFQREYEEAVSEYDSKYSGLPPGLVLPNGMTVQEILDSGQAPGGK